MEPVSTERVERSQRPVSESDPVAQMTENELPRQHRQPRDPFPPPQGPVTHLIPPEPFVYEEPRTHASDDHHSSPHHPQTPLSDRPVEPFESWWHPARVRQHVSHLQTEEEF